MGGLVGIFAPWQKGLGWAILGGALSGVAASVAGQVVINAATHRPLDEGLWQAVGWGAATGALGGAVGYGIWRWSQVRAAQRVDAFELEFEPSYKMKYYHLASKRTGQLLRPYWRSRLLMQEIMRSSAPIPDPLRRPGVWRWDVPGSYYIWPRGAKPGHHLVGTWEFVVDVVKKEIIHFLLRPPR